MFFLKFFTLALIPVFLIGCAAQNPARLPGRPATPAAVEPAVLGQRAAELATTLAPCPVRAIALRPERLNDTDVENPTALMARIHAFGFNRVLIGVSSKAWLESPLLLQLLTAAHGEGLQVWLGLRQSDFVKQHHGNAFLRLFWNGPPDLPRFAVKVANFYSSLPADEKFAGVVLIAEPHLFTKANAAGRPKDLLFAWEPDRYGIDGDNDLIMRRTFQELTAAADTLAPIPVTIGVTDFFHDDVQAGRLSLGSTNDFLAIAPNIVELIIDDNGNKPSETVAVVSAELADTAKPHSVLVGVDLAEHTSVTVGALRRRDWADFIRAVSYAIGQWQNEKAFNGVVIGPLSLIETIQQEK